MNRISLLALVTLLACNAGPTVESGTPQADDAAQGLGELSLSDVQKALDARRSTWTAGETSMSALPRDVRVQMLGVPDSELPADDVRVLIDSSPNDALPALLDWRNHEGKSYVSPMLDQGRCGSCVAFAAVGTFETQLNIAADDATSPFQLSPQHLFACGGGACNWGWMPGSAAKYLVKNGVTDNACFPYTSGAHADDAECRDRCSDASQRVRKAASYGTPRSSVTAVKEALVKGPLMASMTVYDDFMYYTGGVYRHTTGGKAGGHAVSIVGWNDEHQSWIVRNSWGEGWGMGGFFEIAWDDASGVGRSTWSLTAPTPGPYVSFVGVRDHDVLSGNAFAIELAAEGVGSELSWSLSQGATQKASGTSTTIDTTQIADGVYTLRAHAPGIDGERRIVSILNGDVSGTITFRNLNEGQTLKGTALWDIGVESTPVPLTRVSWTFVNSAGETIMARESLNVGPLMELGWNTKKWPNGEYTINVTGDVLGKTISTATRHVKVKN